VIENNGDSIDYQISLKLNRRKIMYHFFAKNSNFIKTIIIYSNLITD